MKSILKKYRNLAILLLIFNFLFVSSAFGQMIPAELINEEEAAIFPFENTAEDDSDFVMEAGEERFNAYSEDFYEVTDEGIYDADGNLLERIDDEAVFDESMVDEEAADKFENLIPEDVASAFEAYKDSIIENWGGKRAFTEKRLQGIRLNLAEEIRRFDELDEGIVTIEEKFEPIRQEIENLKQQIDLLNRQLLLSQTKIKNVELQIAEKQILLRDLLWELKKRQIAFDIQQEIVLDYILLVYLEEEKFLDFYDESSSTLKLLLADNSVTENLLGLEYSKVLESTGRKVFYDLHAQKLALEEKQEQIEEEKAELDGLNESLNQERRILEEGRFAKKELLEATRGEEELYQKLLDESIRQQLESAIAIQNLKDNIEFIEEKLDLLDESLETVEEFAADPENAEILEGIETEFEEREEEIIEEFIEGDLEEAAVRQYPLSWPIPPIKVTAYFQDPTYPKRWGTHNATDLRAKQFTEIRAPANAYVFQTKDNGMGYSYIILAHKNKLITVYGHVAEILAKPGTVVKEGEVIGLTGGTPGTKGSGWQTTGPHLHFEVWYKGEPVDALDYLPIFELPIEYIPDRFLTNE